MTAFPRILVFLFAGALSAGCSDSSADKSQIPGLLPNSDSIPDSRNTRQKLPAIRWILDVMSGASNDGPGGEPRSNDHRVFRIDNPEVLDFFELEPRKGYLYSRNEIAGKAREFHEKVDQIREKKRPEQMNVFEKRLVAIMLCKEPKNVQVRITFRACPSSCAP